MHWHDKSAIRAVKQLAVVQGTVPSDSPEPAQAQGATSNSVLPGHLPPLDIACAGNCKVRQTVPLRLSRHLYDAFFCLQLIGLQGIQANCLQNFASELSRQK